MRIGIKQKKNVRNAIKFGIIRIKHRWLFDGNIFNREAIRRIWPMDFETRGRAGTRIRYIYYFNSFFFFAFRAKKNKC